MGAFRKYLSDMLGATWTASGADFATFAPAFDALLKVLMLDRFKLINDSLGDAVLIEVARRLGAVCRNSDTLALYPDDGGDIASLLRNPDAAMYAAKAAGRNTFRFYDAAMNRRASQRLALESDLRRAIVHGQLEVHYQPQLYSADGRLAGVEALLRWQHPKCGQVSPVEFIPLAEAARQMVDWRARGIAVPRVAVNLSPRQFHAADLAERL